MQAYVFRTPVLLTLILAAFPHLVAMPLPNQILVDASPHPYHDHPPEEPVPETFQATRLLDNPVAFVAYALAARIREILYQEPCYCPCDKEEGHSSLLDCFTGNHSIWCSRCQAEVIFCYEDNRKGKTPAQIRKDLAEGRAWRVDLKKYSERSFARLKHDLK